MKKLFLGTILGLALGGVGVAVAQPSSTWGADDLPPRLTANMTRACVPVSGHAFDVLSVDASDGSVQLTANAVFEIKCSVDSYVEWGDAAAPTADVNSPKDLLADTPWFFGSGSNHTRYVSAVEQSDVDAGGTCKILRCR